MVFTIRKCIEMLKEENPDTGLTEYALRQLVKDEKVAHIRVGKKVLVNFELLKNFLGGEI